MKRLFYWLSIATLTSCGEMKLVDPATNPELLATLCDDVTWIKSKLQEQYGSPLKWEIYTNIYKGMRVFEVNDCLESCADVPVWVYDCSGETLCQFGGIAGVNTCPDYPFASENRVLLWHN